MAIVNCSMFIVVVRVYNCKSISLNGSIFYATGREDKNAERVCEFQTSVLGTVLAGSTFKEGMNGLPTCKLLQLHNPLSLSSLSCLPLKGEGPIGPPVQSILILQSTHAFILVNKAYSFKLTLQAFSILQILATQQLLRPT